MALDMEGALGMHSSTPPDMLSGAKHRMPSQETEEELIGFVLSGENYRFQELLEPYKERLYRMALAVVRNGADAEDVVQESCLKAFINLRRFRSDSRFSTWLTSIVLNEARALVRARRYIAYEPLDTCWDGEGAFFLDIVCKRPLPVDVLEESEIRWAFGRAIQGLPQTYREIYDLREIEECSTEYAAEYLGIPVPLVKTRLHRARKMLRERVAILMGVRRVPPVKTRSEMFA